jgi:hypothetical protein
VDEAQGFPVIENALHKDNQSYILLATNGRQSSEANKHFNLRYFFVKDKIDSGDIIIRYCQTGNNIIIKHNCLLPLLGLGD